MTNIWEKPDWEWYRLGRWTSWLFRNLKYTKQRATRGYCDVDLYDLRLYLSYILANGLEHMANKAESTPFNYEDREWREKLSSLAPTFKKVVDYIELNTPEFDRFCEMLAKERFNNAAATEEGFMMMNEEAAALGKIAWSSIHRLGVELNTEVPSAFSELGTIFMHLWD